MHYSNSPPLKTQWHVLMNGKFNNQAALSPHRLNNNEVETKKICLNRQINGTPFFGYWIGADTYIMRSIDSTQQEEDQVIWIQWPTPNTFFFLSICKSQNVWLTLSVSGVLNNQIGEREKVGRKTLTSIIPGHNTHAARWLCIDWGLFKQNRPHSPLPPPNQTKKSAKMADISGWRGKGGWRIFVPFFS